jgi:hypothetical protein
MGSQWTIISPLMPLTFPGFSWVFHNNSLTWRGTMTWDLSHTASCTLPEPGERPSFLRMLFLVELRGRQHMCSTEKMGWIDPPTYLWVWLSWQPLPTKAERNEGLTLHKLNILLFQNAKFWPISRISRCNPSCNTLGLSNTLSPRLLPKKYHCCIL